MAGWSYLQCIVSSTSRGLLIIETCNIVRYGKSNWRALQTSVGNILGKCEPESTTPPKPD
ncbi:hypothetical protein MY1884_009667, partial [Beauveria asiatica]